MRIRQKTIFDVIEEEGTIFKDKSVFTTEYIPEIYQYRDHQLDSMAFHSRKVKSGYAPYNMLLKGTNATGKTTTLKKYFQLIKEAYSNVFTVYINCKIHRTEYQIFSEVYKTLFHEDIATLNTYNFYNRIMDYLTENKIILILGLDEFDNIKNSIELNRTLYDFLRAHEEYPDVQISVITVSSSKNITATDLNVSTIHLPIEIGFPFYTQQEVYSILKQRVDLGFYPGVISEDLIAYISERAYRLGNLRIGIKKLEHAGDRAEYKGHYKIEKADLM
ncbi:MULTISPECIES: AAA family ATPase [Methanobrevibacter]|uniref:AAA family ATPase n=1 Tax=Methanobrevibacter TaxID=2172 RepID=UPI00033482DD|nr:MULTISPECIES: AAA family ATPase [Methanobrevibacter]AGN16284.1 cdc6 family replication initiation protein Cdc6-3 [Methanobrevibacter sp. AbM4]MCI6774429.1 AAA family ATPase [Methanobrevibacter boviskoreani]MCI6930854.1 AAA family ATPase [Methanobrevibacter boviskoreani]MDD6256464.1 AAA family ATPase [Methanobrevibacter boviskoreani]MDY5614595.1 AAA family ATPase [Methanobrevibacter boviskoreani]